MRAWENRWLRAAVILVVLTAILSFAQTYGAIVATLWVGRPWVTIGAFVLLFLFAAWLDRLRRRTGRPAPLDWRAALIGTQTGGLAGFVAFTRTAAETS